MTNHHCLPGPQEAHRAVVEFGVVHQFLNAGMERVNVNLSPVFSDEGLDISVLRVDGRPGDRWGFLEISFRAVSEGAPLNIFHHPAGQPMRLSRIGCIGGPISANIREEYFLHQCDTLGGSSGAPVLDENFRVVGIHHRGTVDRGVNAYNQGTELLFGQRSLDQLLQARANEFPFLQGELSGVEGRTAGNVFFGRQDLPHHPQGELNCFGIIGDIRFQDFDTWTYAHFTHLRECTSLTSREIESLRGQIDTSDLEAYARGENVGVSDAEAIAYDDFLCAVPNDQLTDVERRHLNLDRSEVWQGCEEAETADSGDNALIEF
jgi:hypothetical protein